MKILMLTWEYPPRVVGGISRVVYDLSKTLHKDGHDVTVITYREGDAPYFEDDKGIKVYRVDNYMINPNNFIDWILQLNFNMIAKANEIIREEGNFDVIHAHDWLVAYSAKTLKNSYNIPIVATIHATEAGRNSGIHDEQQRYINDTEWMLTYEAAEVVVNSNYMKNELQRLFGLPYDKINVIPNGVNLNLFNGIERDYNFRRKFAMDNEKIILFMGRLVYEKGIQHLISAMPKILEGYHDSKLVICGKGGMEWMLTYEAAEVVVNSNYMKNELQRLFGLPYDKINVIPNGVNLNLFNGIERDYNFRRKFAMDNEKIILFMGRLVYEKGIQHLISAMPKILEGYHDSKLVICGKGGMEEELKNQVKAMGIENKVFFAGYMKGKDVQRMYKAADVAVFPSTYEPFGIVALEAMLSEKPIVVSDIGGLNEIVDHKKNGMKAYCGNSNSIADSILEVLYDHKLCADITRVAKNKVRNEYNWSKIAQDTHFAYQKAICQSMAEKQKRELEQERARKTKKAKNTENEITNLLSFKKRQAYA